MMHTKKSLGSKIFDFVNILFLSLLTLSVIYPFVYMFSQSISDYVAVGKGEITFLPKGIQWESYKTVLGDSQIGTAYANSIYYTVVATVITVFANGLAAYSISHPDFKMRKFFVMMFMFTMFFSGGMIPNYLNKKNLGLLDTVWAMVHPSVSMWNIMLMQTNFKQISPSLRESAYLDGAGDWYVFWRIYMPLSKAIIATVAVFAAVTNWNNYFAALLYLTSPSKEPLPVLLRRILISNENLQSSVEAAAAATSSLSGDTDPVTYQGMMTSIKMATVFVTIGPIILVYPFAQKYFVKGVMVGSVKG
ncbi:MAG: carbohydrate ABC transporter permease [Clostridia bacterium]|nr:carbohydrate ABC transporter permease [Clostridia bacterium]